VKSSLNVDSVAEGVEFECIRAYVCGVPLALVQFWQEEKDVSSACLSLAVFLSLFQQPRLIPALVSDPAGVPAIVKLAQDLPSLRSVIHNRSGCQAGTAIVDCFGKALQHWPSEVLTPFKYEGRTLWTMSEESLGLKASFIQTIQKTFPMLEKLAKKIHDPKASSFARHLERFKEWLEAGNFDSWRVKFSVDRGLEDVSYNGILYPKTVRNLCATCDQPASMGNFSNR
jgi:hypothetical protein